MRRFSTMSTDKESSGLPEINVRRRTTKVNFAVIGGILLFFAIAATVAVNQARRSPAAAAPSTTQGP